MYTYSVQQQRGGGRLVWQTVCATSSYHFSKGMACMRRPNQREAAVKGGKVMRQRVGTGCKCNIDDITACYVDYFGMLTRVLCVLMVSATDSSGQRKSLSYSGLWSYTRIPYSPSHAHPAQRAPVVTMDSFRIVTVDPRPQTRGSSSGNLILLFSPRISHRSLWFVRDFEIPIVSFSLQTQNILSRFSQVASNPTSCK